MRSLPSLLASLCLPHLIAFGASAQGTVRLAATTPAPDVERRLAFGPAAVGIAVEKQDMLAIRASDEDLEVRIAVRRAAMSQWLAGAEVMLLLVGDFEPVPPLKAENGSMTLRPVTTWGSPRYELTIANRDRSRAVVAELHFEEANDLLRTLRGVAPVIDRPKPSSAVDRPVVPRSGNRAPTYPAFMRRNGVGGEVVLRVVIDTSGRVEQESIEVVRSSDPRLLRAVYDAIRSWRFEPAQSQGARVPQLVELPFLFDPAR